MSKAVFCFHFVHCEILKKINVDTLDESCVVHSESVIILLFMNCLPCFDETCISPLISVFLTKGCMIVLLVSLYVRYTCTCMYVKCSSNFQVLKIFLNLVFHLQIDIHVHGVRVHV